MRAESYRNSVIPRTSMPRWLSSCSRMETKKITVAARPIASPALELVVDEVEPQEERPPDQHRDEQPVAWTGMSMPAILAGLRPRQHGTIP